MCKLLGPLVEGGPGGAGGMTCRCPGPARAAGPEWGCGGLAGGPSRSKSWSSEALFQSSALSPRSGEGGPFCSCPWPVAGIFPHSRC